MRHKNAPQKDNQVLRISAPGQNVVNIRPGIPGFLRIIAGPAGNESLSLEMLGPKARLVFGRHRLCDHVLSHPTVSRQHFFIELTGGKALIVDNSSGNGTFVNNERISWAELKAGDRIQAGPFLLVAESSPGSGTESSLEMGVDISDGASVGLRESGELISALHSKFHGFYPREYLEGVELFNLGRYFEAHEIWEEIWLRSSGQEKLFYQMLIQSAVGLHHFERNNWTGARGMHRRVSEKLAGLPRVYMSLDLVSFEQQFKAVLKPLIEQGIETPQPQVPRPVLELFGQP